jgi:MFS-type transporter involved in bile tolerance (Atg22 family)
LEVRVHSDEGKRLAASGDGLSELIAVGEYAIVGVIVEYRDSVRRFLCSYCFFGACGLLKVNVAEPCGLIDQVICYLVAQLGRNSSELGDSAGCFRLQLVG